MWRRSVFAQAGPAVTLSRRRPVSDADNATLVSATVSIAGGFLAGDTLGVTNQGGITGSYNGGDRGAEPERTGTVAHYQAVLEAVSLLLEQPEPDQLQDRYQPQHQLGGE